MKKPEKNEYAPAYQKYIDLLDTGNFIELLDQNTTSTISFFKSIDKEKENYRYAENKWTIKEVFMHLIDTERGFSYRAIVCVRNDNKTPLYGMDEDFYAKNVDVTETSMDSLIEEFIAVRRSFKLIYTNNKVEKSKLFRKRNWSQNICKSNRIYCNRSFFTSLFCNKAKILLR